MQATLLLGSTPAFILWLREKFDLLNRAERFEIIAETEILRTFSDHTRPYKQKMMKKFIIRGKSK